MSESRDPYIEDQIVGLEGDDARDARAAAVSCEEKGRAAKAAWARVQEARKEKEMAEEVWRVRNREWDKADAARNEWYKLAAENRAEDREKARTALNDAVAEKNRLWNAMSAKEKKATSLDINEWLEEEEKRRLNRERRIK